MIMPGRPIPEFIFRLIQTLTDSCNQQATTTEEEGEGEESAASSPSFENIPSSTPRRGTKYSIGLGKNKPVYSSSSSDDDNDYSNENENDEYSCISDKTIIDVNNVLPLFVISSKPQV